MYYKNNSRCFYKIVTLLDFHQACKNVRKEAVSISLKVYKHKISCFCNEMFVFECFSIILVVNITPCSIDRAVCADKSPQSA
jgi:hypothetical protein